MDFLYYTVYYGAILFTPITLYFLIFKKRNCDGSYEEAGEFNLKIVFWIVYYIIIFSDWFYPVRYFVAANEVKKYVNKSKNIVEKLYATLETEINISSVEVSKLVDFFKLFINKWEMSNFWNNSTTNKILSTTNGSSFRCVFKRKLCICQKLLPDVKVIFRMGAMS